MYFLFILSLFSQFLVYDDHVLHDISFYFAYFIECFTPFHATALFLYPLKHQKASTFLMFLERVERDQWHEKVDQRIINFRIYW